MEKREDIRFKFVSEKSWQSVFSEATLRDRLPENGIDLMPFPAEAV